MAVGQIKFFFVGLMKPLSDLFLHPQSFSSYSDLTDSFHALHLIVSKVDTTSVDNPDRLKEVLDTKSPE